MDDHDIDLNELLDDEAQGNLIEIPQEFRSVESGLHFSHCLSCDTPLMDIASPYVIEKAMKQYEGYTAHDVIFEYAMCLPCVDKKRKSLSQESQVAVENYFLSNMHGPENVRDGGNGLAQCWMKGTPRNELREYQIFGLFRGDKMIATQPPYLIGEAAIEEMSDLLSSKTIDDMNRFIDTHFGGPPELRDILKDHKAYIL